MKKLHFLTLAIFLIIFGSCDSKKDTPEEIIKPRVTVEMTTDFGTMIFELYNETPLHRDNFVKLTNDKVFDSLLFHRVIDSFVIQAGNPDTKYNQPIDSIKRSNLAYKVDAEFPTQFFHKKGALGAARDGNLARASSSTQFYFSQGKVHSDSSLTKAQNTINERLAAHYFKNDSVNKPIMDALNKALEERNRELYFKLNDSITELSKNYTNFESYSIPEEQWEAYKTIGGIPTLDRNYTVFGEIIEGLSILDSIASVATNERDKPISDVRIHTVRIISKQ